MSKGTIIIDPVTRIEGHLAVEVQHEDGRVTEARCSGTLFRGLELVLRGRDPRDAPILTQRICGVCPQSHATASAKALDEAFGIAADIPHNGRLLRDIMLAANYLQSHILHFYHLAALDYVDVTAVKDYAGRDSDLCAVKDFVGRGKLSPFVPRYEGDYRLAKEENIAAVKHYVEALDARRQAHELLALFGGKAPHQCTVNVGGVGTEVTADRIVRGLSYAQKLREFIRQDYLPDVLLVAERYPDYFRIGAGCGRFLSYGAFDALGEPLLGPGILGPEGDLSELDPGEISEQVARSYYAEESAAPTPFESDTVPQEHKSGAYSWLKAPRYDGKVCEVGPLARTMVSYARGNPAVRDALEGLLKQTGLEPQQLNSTLGRHAARALEASIIADALEGWIAALKPGEPCMLTAEVPEAGQGAGLVEAPRGALGHWVRIEGGKIANYQAVVPTTWNGSPRDGSGQPGAIEQAIQDETIRDPDNPFEVVRIIRSFDPCLACGGTGVGGQQAEPAVAVVGMGNLLMRDEGLGIHAVRHLQNTGQCAEAARLIDGGTDAWGALCAAGACEHMLLVDAVRGGRPPGSIYVLSLDELNARADPVSLHDISLAELTHIHAALGEGPRTVRVVGMEPAVIAFGLELSEPCEQAMPELIRTVLGEIRRLHEQKQTEGARRC